MSTLQSWKAFLAPKLRRVVEFLTAQGITLAGNLLYGFLCVRLLPIPEYAKFAVVFGFLGTLTLLMDINFSGALIPLVGERVNDLQLIADYVASLRQLAHRLYMVVAPAAILAYPFLVRRQNWSWQIITAMIAILLVAAWCARISGAYGAVLIVRRDHRVWYRAQMISSLGTLALLGIFWAAHWINAFSAILINVAGIIFVCISYFFRARHLLGVVGRPSKEKRKAIVHLAMPNMSNAIFYAFQGQISLLLITFFGHSTAVASVGALGRLSQGFSLFSQMNPLLLEPYFAKLPKTRLKANYLGVIAAETVLCIFITALSWLFPQVFLWILGPKYSGLHVEVLLTIAARSLGYLCGVLWVIHSARRFVYWWNGMMTIAVTLLVQIVFIWKVDLSTVRAVLTLGLATSAAVLLVNVLTGIYGFSRGPRNLHRAESKP
jgi:O-antigen/teichoic acid export membrane protein